MERKEIEEYMRRKLTDQAIVVRQWLTVCRVPENKDVKTLCRTMEVLARWYGMYVMYRSVFFPDDIPEVLHLDCEEFRRAREELYTWKL